MVFKFNYNHVVLALLVVMVIMFFNTLQPKPQTVPICNCPSCICTLENAQRSERSDQRFTDDYNTYQQKLKPVQPVQKKTSLLEKPMDIYLKRNTAFPIQTWHKHESTYSPPYYMGLPVPETDHNTRVILQNQYETPLGDVHRAIFQNRCDGTNPPIYIDVGANLGVFTFAVANFGCHAVAVEAQTRLMPYISTTALANGWNERIRIAHKALYDKKGSIEISNWDPDPNKNGHIWLAMQLGSEGCVPEIGCTVETIPMVETHAILEEALQAFPYSEILFVKIDVDGPEIPVLRGLLPAIKKGIKIPNIMVEVCPGGWNNHSEKEPGVNLIKSMATDYGYTIIILNQIDFIHYKSGFLDRTTLLPNPFQPKSYIVPVDMIHELFEDGTTAIVNCKNVLFTKELEILKNQPSFL